MGRNPRIDPPEWWEWGHTFTAHLESRMEDREFSEVELRSMVTDATDLAPAWTKMSLFSIEIAYRNGAPFAAYIYLPRAPGMRSARTDEVTPELLIDYTADGSPLGIEIVSPGYVTEEEIYAAFDRLGIERPSSSELAPLRAA